MTHDPVEDVCDCGALLTKEEQYHYAGSCESCAAAWSERVDRWRKGSPDRELDEAFGVKRQLQ